MRYIRTIDGRIINISNVEIKKEIYENDKLKIYEYWSSRFVDREVIRLFADEVLKTADNLEELIDMCVDICDAFPHAHQEKETVEKFDIVYGAVWTDERLVYVAKINDKGELELL